MIQCGTRLLIAGISLTLFLLTLPTSAIAQLEEVLVTAQKREESIQETPVAVTAYNEELLQNLDIDNLNDLRVTSPSIQGYDFPTSANTISLFIRGLGNLDSQTLTTDNPVGVYVDDVYIARTTGALIDVLDLERIEVLRGPQGTLYGRNSSAGAVKFVTRRPSDERSFRLNASAGNFGEYKLGLSADLPFSENVRSKISVMGSGNDGWVENKGPNPVSGQPTEDFNFRDQIAGRFALSWDVNDAVTVDYAIDHTEVDSTPPYYQSAATFNDRDEETSLFGGPFRYVLPEGEMEQTGHNLTVTWEVSDALSVKSISSYREMDDSVVQNWSDTLFFATDIDYGTEAWSQEIQFLGGNECSDWVAGIYYFNEDGEKLESQFLSFDASAIGSPVSPIVSPDVLLLPFSGQPFVPFVFGGPVGTSIGFAEFDTSLESTAVFGQFSYQISDQIRGTVGMRYTQDERDASRSGTNFSFTTGSNSASFNSTDYTLILEYAPSDSVNLYGKVATGYRSGGSSERAPDFAQTFEPEEVTSYELGMKADFMDDRLRINAALFKTDTDDAINTVGGVGSQAALQETFNFGNVDIEGLELEVLAALTDSTRLGINYTYLDSELSGVIVPAESVLRPPGTDITASTFVPQTPDSAYSITFDQDFSLGRFPLALHLNYSYRDELHSSAITPLIDSFAEFNGRLSARDIEIGGFRMDVGLWVNNLTDEDEIVYNLSNSGYQYNQPRNYGIDFSFEF